jgi:phage recombination protein Bet
VANHTSQQADAGHITSNITTMKKEEKINKKTTETEVVESKPESSEKTADQLSEKDRKEVRIIERVIENREIAPADAFGKLTRSQVELIKRTVAKGASDDELRLFVQVCKGANLNPFLRQVHLVPRWDSKSGVEVRAIQVGIDGFRAVAESSGAYAGNDDPIFDGEHEIPFTKYENKKPIEAKLTVPGKATVTVYKLMDGQRYGFTATARWEEYYPGQKMGFQWHIRPYLMLGKCAEALALRKAFPKLLSGMYASEEMDRTAQADNDVAKVQKGFQTLMTAVTKASLKELEDYKSKMESSDKYSEDQKAEFLEVVEKRIAELKVADQK